MKRLQENKGLAPVSDRQNKRKWSILLFCLSFLIPAVAEASATVSGDTTSGVILTVYAPPSIDTVYADTLCAGVELNRAAPKVDFKGVTLGTTEGWLLGGVAITMPYTVAVADSGKTLQYWAKNVCDSVVTSPNIQLVVYTMPVVEEFSAPAALCVGEALILTPPKVTSHGTVLTGQGWLLGADAIVSGYVPTLADNGKKLYYWATNKCSKVDVGI